MVALALFDDLCALELDSPRRQDGLDLVGQREVKVMHLWRVTHPGVGDLDPAPCARVGPIFPEAFGIVDSDTYALEDSAEHVCTNLHLIRVDAIGHITDEFDIHPDGVAQIELAEISSKANAQLQIAADFFSQDFRT